MAAAQLFLFQPTVAPKVFMQDVAYMRASWARARAMNSVSRYAVTTLLQFAAVLLALAALVALDWRRALVFWVAPRLFAQWAIVTMNLLQHDGCDDEAKKNMNFARNFVSRRLNWLMFENGLHTIHHLMPNAHWSQLPELHRRIVVPYINPKLNEPSMLLYIWRTYVFPPSAAFSSPDTAALPAKTAPCRAMSPPAARAR